MPPNGKIYSDAAVIIAHTRSGGTFLANGLSNHPEIFCPRGEPLLRGMEWGTAFKEASDTQILDCIMSAAFYKVGMCKVTYDQATGEVLQYISKRRAPIIHLVRENYLRVVVSQMITGQVANGRLDHTAHSMKSVEPPSVKLNPDRVLQHCGQMWEKVRRMHNTLSGVDARVLYLTYDRIVGGEGNEVDKIQNSDQICDFLGVSQKPLPVQLKRVNKAPLTTLVKNWGQIEGKIKGSNFEYCLEDEKIWVS